MPHTAFRSAALQARAICQQIKTLSWAQAQFPSIQHPKHYTILDLQLQLNKLIAQFPSLAQLQHSKYLFLHSSISSTTPTKNDRICP